MLHAGTLDAAIRASPHAQQSRVEYLGRVPPDPDLGTTPDAHVPATQRAHTVPVSSMPIPTGPSSIPTPAPSPPPLHPVPRPPRASKVPLFCALQAAQSSTLTQFGFVPVRSDPGPVQAPSGASATGPADSPSVSNPTPVAHQHPLEAPLSPGGEVSPHPLSHSQPGDTTPGASPPNSPSTPPGSPLVATSLAEPPPRIFQALGLPPQAANGQVLR